MFKRVKILALPLLLVVIFAALPLAGCGGTPGDDGNGGGNLTQQELQQVMADSMVAYEDAASYAFTYDMSMNMEMAGGSSPGTMEMTMRGDGKADVAASTMLMDLDVSLDSDVQGMEGSQEMSAEMYMLTDWIYMNLEMTGMGKQWVKTPVTEDVKEAFNMNVVDQQLMPLESMGEVEFLKYESVDGSQCFVLSIVPDIDAMKAWLEAQQITSTTADWDMLVGDMFNELSYKVWVDTETNLLKKMTMVVDMNLTASQVGATDTDFDSMTMHMELEMTLSDYNEPITIDLPDEALDAQEM